MTLRDWRLVPGGLQGHVFGHPKHPDGAAVRTSGLESDLKECRPGATVRTKNREYRLEGDSLRFDRHTGRWTA